MIQSELQQLKAGPKELRKFGLLVGGVFAVLGTLFLIRHRPLGPYLAAPGVLLMVFGVIAPTALKGPYRAWMTLALILGMIVNTVVLTLFYFLVITPVGWIARLAGQDFLALKRDGGTASYWLKKPRPASGEAPNYEKQY